MNTELTEEESPLQAVEANLGELDDSKSTQPVDRLENLLVSYPERSDCGRNLLTVAAAAPLVRHPRELTSAL